MMHHPEDIKYLPIFNIIKNNSDHTLKRALYYFAHTLGGPYTPKPPHLSTQLAKWYTKEINEKELDNFFDDIIKEERSTFEELLHLGIGISIDANLRLTKKRFARIKKFVTSNMIREYKELAGPFLINESSMLACKIMRRQIND
jgi:hypothetical protein